MLHQRQVYTMLNLLGDFGGLQGILWILVSLVCYTASHSFVMGDFFSQMYFNKRTQISDSQIFLDEKESLIMDKLRIETIDHLWQIKCLRPIMSFLGLKP